MDFIFVTDLDLVAMWGGGGGWGLNTTAPRYVVYLYRHL